MITLTDTTQALKVVTTTSSDIDVFCSYVIYGRPSLPIYDTQFQVTSASTETIVTNPVPSTEKEIKTIIMRNIGGVSNNITIIKTVFSTVYELFSCDLAADEQLTYSYETGWQVYDSTGVIKFSTSGGGGGGGGDASAANQVTEIARLDSILAKMLAAPATEAKQLPDNHQVTVSNQLVQPLTDVELRAAPVPVSMTGGGDATGANQETQILLIETLQELSARLQVLAGMANAGQPALRVAPISSVSTAVTGSVTATVASTVVSSLTNFGTGIPANIIAWSQQNLLATQANINNVSA